MSINSLAAKARRHWATWRPKDTARLKSLGIFLRETKKAAVRANSEILSLMRQGYRQDEAEELVLPCHILLPPEPPDEDDELEQERAELEARYRYIYGPIEGEDE